MNLKNYQLDYNEAKRYLPKRNQRYGISIILNNVSDPINVGSFFRLADNAFLERIYLCGDTPTPDNNKKIKITGKFGKTIAPYTYYEDINKILGTLENNYQIYIVELTNKSISYFETEFPKDKKLAFIFGSESKGVDQSVLDKNYQTIHVPIFGYDYSMNVAACANLVVYETIRKLYYQ